MKECTGPQYQGVGRFSDDDCPSKGVNTKEEIDAMKAESLKEGPWKQDEVPNELQAKAARKILAVHKNPPKKLKAKFGFKKPKKITAKQAVLSKDFDKSNFTADLIETIKKKAAADRQGALVDEIYKRLAALGHVFEGENKEQESKDFFRDRLRIARDKEDNCYVYLDYVDNENRGTLIIWYNPNMIPEVKIEVERNGGVKMTVVT